MRTVTALGKPGLLNAYRLPTVPNASSIPIYRSYSDILKLVLALKLATLKH